VAGVVVAIWSYEALCLVALVPVAVFGTLILLRVRTRAAVS
jgi:hypothetical protein